jgi:hypothetical protein
VKMPSASSPSPPGASGAMQSILKWVMSPSMASVTMCCPAIGDARAV